MSRAQLHFVTGKGGVGKSTIAAGLAMAAAARDLRVLAIELSGPGGLCGIFGVSPDRPGSIAPVGPNLWLSVFDGADALAEYLTRKVRLGRLTAPVLEHPIYRAFVGAAPGVRELMAIGKVRDEMRRRANSHRRWDVVVVDAGASGHALSYLRIPAAAARAFSRGRVHRESSRIDRLLRDPGRSAIHVVATPEHMPLAEAADLVDRVRGELSMPLGRVFVNMCRPIAPPSIDAVIASLPQDAAGGALSRVAAMARGWERLQESGIAELEARSGVVAVRLPRLWRDAGRGVAEALTPTLDEAAL